MARDLSKIRRGARGTDLGGEFIGPKSIAKFLVSLAAGGRHRKPDEPHPPGSLTGLPRPKLLAAARAAGVKQKRGAPAHEIAAAVRAQRGPEVGAVAKKVAAAKKAPVAAKRARKAAAAAPDAGGPITRALAAQGLGHLKGPGRTDMARAIGVPGIHTALDLRSAERALKAVPGRAPGERPAGGVEGAIRRWMRGSGVSEGLFDGFDREDLRKAAKARGIPLKRGADKGDILVALLNGAREEARRARDEAAHPPAGIPPGAPIIRGESKFHRAFDEETQRLADAVASGLESRKMANQGMVGETWFEKFRNGVQAVHKWSKRDWAGADAKTQADAEQLASLLGRAIGAPVPPVYRHNDTEIYMGLIPNAKTGNRVFHGENPPQDVLDRPEVRRLGLLDLLTSNFDRHGENYMVDKDGKLWGIDHGLAWSPQGVRQQPPHQAPSLGFSPFADVFLHESENGAWHPEAEFTSGGMTPAELAEVRAQVVALGPDFQRLGHRDWHEYALTRLDAIIAAANGKKFERPPRQRGIGGKLPRGVGVHTAAVGAAESIREDSALDTRRQMKVLRDQPDAVLRKMLVQQGLWAEGELQGMNRETLIQRAENVFIGGFRAGRHPSAGGAPRAPWPPPAPVKAAAPRAPRPMAAGARAGRVAGKRLPAGVGVQTAAEAALVHIQDTADKAHRRKVIADQPVPVLRRLLRMRMGLGEGEVAKLKRDELVGRLEVVVGAHVPGARRGR